MVVALAALAPRPAQADSSVEERVVMELVTKAVADHGVECTWVLGDETFAGKDLIARGYKFAVTGMSLDGRQAGFYLELTAPKKGAGVAKAAEWYHTGTWGVVRQGDAWKVTDQPETIVAQHPKATPSLKRMLKLPF